MVFSFVYQRWTTNPQYIASSLVFHRCSYIYIYIYIYICVFSVCYSSYVHTYCMLLRSTSGIRRPGRARRSHSCHILPFQPILWNINFPSEPVKTTENSPQSISEGGRIWQVCNVLYLHMCERTLCMYIIYISLSLSIYLSLSLSFIHIYVYIYIYVCVYIYVYIYM